MAGRQHRRSGIAERAGEDRHVEDSREHCDSGTNDVSRGKKWPSVMNAPWFSRRKAGRTRDRVPGRDLRPHRIQLLLGQAEGVLTEEQPRRRAVGLDQPK